MRAKQFGWAICERNGSLMLLESQLPIYWLRYVAVAAAKERGFQPNGVGRDCIIQRVSIRAARQAQKRAAAA
jgi:hypothetical protein